MKTKNNKKNNPEIVKEIPTISRKGNFLFYDSYFEAINTLSNKNRLIAYEAIVKYALYGEETKSLPLQVLAIFKMAIPTIDSAHKNYRKRIERNSKDNAFKTTPIFEEAVMLPKKEKKLIENSSNNDEPEFTGCSDDIENEFEP